MLTPLARDLWGADGTAPQPGGVVLPTRMTIARLRDGSLWLHSPVEVDDALAAEIDALGEVRTLVAPNLLHYRFLGAAAARWPTAKVLGAPGLARKRPDLRIDGELVEGAIQGTFTPFAWKAPRCSEKRYFSMPPPAPSC